jgi:hypothetical protein
MRLHATRSPETDLSDRILLTIPTDAGFRSVATLVLGGLGSRADLSYERMDDLQLAVLSALEATNGSSVTLDIHVDGDRIDVAIGPLALADDGEDGLDLVLTRLVEEVAHERREGAAWVVLTLSRAAAP